MGPTHLRRQKLDWLARTTAALLLAAAASCASALPFPVPPDSFGPFVRLSSVNSGRNATVSILAGVHGKTSWSARQVRLDVSRGVVLRSKSPEVLLSHANYTLVRWVLVLPLHTHQTVYHYRVRSSNKNVKLGPNVTATHTITVPGRSEQWHIAYYSCNGFHDPAEAPPTGIEPMWGDLLAVHRQRPLHLVIGNGDQLYNDGVMQDVPALSAVYNANTSAPALAFRWNASVAQQTEDWLFSHYAYWWAMESRSYTTALAQIPFVMIWDDHEMFNGWGSQPDFLLQSEFMKGYFQLALRWYLAFQHHSTVDNLMPDLAWNNKGSDGNLTSYSWTSPLDPTTAVLAPDLRSERTQAQVMSNATYARIQQQLDKMPSTVKHLMVATSQPISYDVDTLVANTIFSKPPTGLLGIDLTKYGLPNTWVGLQTAVDNVAALRASLLPILSRTFSFQMGTLDLSDLMDQWDGVNHLVERGRFINLIEAWAIPRGVRVTYMGGDSHGAYAYNLFTTNYTGSPTNDPRWSLTITSSPIGNVPAFGLATLGIERYGPLYQEYVDTTNVTTSRALPLFTGLPGLGNVTYEAFVRNWLDIYSDTDVKGGYDFSLRFEVYDNSTGTPVLKPTVATVAVPPYLPAVDAAGRKREL